MPGSFSVNDIRKVRDFMDEETKHMSNDEILEYTRKRSAVFETRLKAVREKQAPGLAGGSEPK